MILLQPGNIYATLSSPPITNATYAHPLSTAVFARNKLLCAWLFSRIFGHVSHRSEWQLVKIDFRSIFNRRCTEADYQTWHLHDQVRCTPAHAVRQSFYQESLTVRQQPCYDLLWLCFGKNSLFPNANLGNMINTKHFKEYVDMKLNEKYSQYNVCF